MKLFSFIFCNKSKKEKISRIKNKYAYMFSLLDDVSWSQYCALKELEKREIDAL